MSDSILILTTGGTIDKEYFDALSRYQITDTMVGRLLAIAGHASVRRSGSHPQRQPRPHRR